jgi:hypothetical protein
MALNPDSEDWIKEKMDPQAAFPANFECRYWLKQIVIIILLVILQMGDYWPRYVLFQSE